jgi:hypothetical protein
MDTYLSNITGVSAHTVSVGVVEMIRLKTSARKTVGILEFSFLNLICPSFNFEYSIHESLR